jgi:hypothetical protein
MKTLGAQIWLTALVLLLPSGAVVADDAPPAVGSLTVQWTLNGRREPIDCNGLGAERIDLTLNSPLLDEDQWDAPCDAFEFSIDLPPGSYAGEAVLVDRLDRPVTLAVPVEQIDIVAGRNLVKNVDFPVAGFLGATN